MDRRERFPSLSDAFKGSAGCAENESIGSRSLV